MQRFGGALNLNVHFHLLLPDAVFVPDRTTPSRSSRCRRPRIRMSCTSRRSSPGA